MNLSRNLREIMEVYFKEQWNPVRTDLYLQWIWEQNRHFKRSSKASAFIPNETDPNTASSGDITSKVIYVMNPMKEEKMLAAFKKLVQYPDGLSTHNIIAAGFSVPLYIQAEARKFGIWIVDVLAIAASAVERDPSTFRGLRKNWYSYAKCAKELKQMNTDIALIENALIFASSHRETDSLRDLHHLLWNGQFKPLKRYLEMRLTIFMRADRDGHAGKPIVGNLGRQDAIFLRDTLRQWIPDPEFLMLTKEFSTSEVFDQNDKNYYYNCRTQCMFILFSLWNVEIDGETRKTVRNLFLVLRHRVYEIVRQKSYYYYFISIFGHYISESVIREIAEWNAYTSNGIGVIILTSIIDKSKSLNKKSRSHWLAIMQYGAIDRELTELVKGKISSLFYLYEIQSQESENRFYFTDQPNNKGRITSADQGNDDTPGDASQSNTNQWVLIRENPQAGAWNFSLKNTRTRKEKWHLYFQITPEEGDQKCRILSRESAAKEVHAGEAKEIREELPFDKDEIIHRMQDALKVAGYAGAKIVGIWHDSQYNERIPERCLIFDDHIRIYKEDDTVYFRVDTSGQKSGDRTAPMPDTEESIISGESGQAVNIFYHQLQPYKRKINGITALVGKNGTGKSTVFRMIGLDSSPEENKDEFAQYIIFYQINGQYYYSTNRQDGCPVDGIDELFNVSSTQITDSNIIYYSGALSANRETDLNGFHGIDISNGYVLAYENNRRDPARIWNAERFWDTGRKLQLLNDMKISKKKTDSPNFEQLFHFLPTFFHLQIPKSWIPAKYSDVRESGKIKSEATISEEKRSGEIKSNNHESWSIHDLPMPDTEEPWCDIRIPLDDTTIRDCLDLYKVICSPRDKKDINILDIACEIPGLSSGQYALFDLYARLHSFFCSQYSQKNGDYNCFRADNALHNYILLLDEVELYLHPEWQKGFVEQMIDFLEWEQTYRTGCKTLPYENLQIFMASNSPFFMSDLPKANICRLAQPGDANEEAEATFAQNIHTIMKTSFFMGNGLIGDFAARKIDEVIRELLDTENEIEESRREEIRYLISQIGEKLIREPLEKIYRERFMTAPVKQETVVTFDDLQKKLSPELYRAVMTELKPEAITEPDQEVITEPSQEAAIDLSQGNGEM